MKKIIKLFKDFGSLADREPFLCDVTEPLALELESDYNLAGAVVCLQNGMVTGKYRLEDPFTVDSQFLFAGELNVEVRYMKGAEVLKTVRVEPILLKELGGKIEGFPELDEMRERDNERIQGLERLRKENQELRAKHENIETRLAELTTRMELLEKNYDPIGI